jgi:predicted nucleic acid-binding protein
MASLFADTGYWVAILDPKDRLHERALEISKRFGKRQIVTTEMVLVELLGLFAKPPLRDRVIMTVERVFAARTLTLFRKRVSSSATRSQGLRSAPIRRGVSPIARRLS